MRLKFLIEFKKRKNMINEANVDSNKPVFKGFAEGRSK